MLVFGLALLLAQSPSDEDETFREALKQNALIEKRNAELDAAFARELADWKAGKASKVWGPLLDEPDEVTVGRVALDLSSPTVKFRPREVRALSTAERTELKAMLRSGVFHRTRPPPSACGFNPSMGLFWKKGDARASVVVCFDCCQAIADGVGIRSVDCDKLEAWFVTLMKKN